MTRRYACLPTLLIVSILASALTWGCSGEPRRAAGDASADGAAGDAEADTRVDDTGSRPDVPTPTCETVSAVAEALPATLLFQVDTSNSMNCRADDRSCATGDPTPAPDDSRWDVFEATLSAALPSLPDSSSAGLMRFPGPARACAEDVALVDIGGLGTTRGALVSTLAGITPDGLSTPTHDALRFALGQLRALPADNRFLVLATDGDARVCQGCDTACSFDALDRDTDAMIAFAETAADDGIGTFVIGVPGSQGFREELSRLASMAGTARSPTCSDAGPEYCHYDLTDPTLDFAEALRVALAAIGDAVLSCSYDIPPNPDGAFDATQVNVRLTEDDGTERPILRDASRTDGWDYTDDEAQIVLHGAACDAAKAATGGRLDILFGCPTILI